MPSLIRYLSIGTKGKHEVSNFLDQRNCTKDQKFLNFRITDSNRWCIMGVCIPVRMQQTLVSSSLGRLNGHWGKQFSGVA